jgi:hypothetical protein
MGKDDEKTRLLLSEDFAGFMEEFQQESDRAAAILGATYLETRLEVLLRSYLIDRKEVDALFGVNAPLGTFDARRQVAYALGLTVKEENEQLKCIQQIRNRFAHHLHSLQFTDQWVAGKCRELAKFYEDLPIQWGDGDLRHPRWAFTVATIHMMTRLLILVDQVQGGVIPSARIMSAK